MGLYASKAKKHIFWFFIFIEITDIRYHKCRRITRQIKLIIPTLEQINKTARNIKIKWFNLLTRMNIIIPVGLNTERNKAHDNVGDLWTLCNTCITYQ